ncbi:hypothetical protein BDV06DRAFT_204181 [Aspergillus oleicola]
MPADVGITRLTLRWPVKVFKRRSRGVCQSRGVIAPYYCRFDPSQTVFVCGGLPRHARIPSWCFLKRLSLRVTVLIGGVSALSRITWALRKFPSCLYFLHKTGCMSMLVLEST